MTGETPAARRLPIAEYMALKAAMRRLTTACGGQESAASITRVDHQRLSKYGRPGEGMHCPIDVIADLEADSHEPTVTRVLAAISGYALVPRPVADGDPTWVKALGDLAREVGDVIAKIGDALSGDGEITADEIDHYQLRDEIRQAQEVLARMDRALVAIVEGAVEPREME